MPKVQPIKVLNKADFVYSPIRAKKPLSTIPRNTQETQKCDNMDTENSLISIPEEQSKLEKRNNTETIDMTSDAQFDFPRGNTERQKYRTKAGKVSRRASLIVVRIYVFYRAQKITQYQWHVYDFILKIPRGRVTTYKVVSEYVGGSSRSGMLLLVSVISVL